MEITLKIKNVYGNDLSYPVCEKGLVFATMLGRKSLTDRDIRYIKELGYVIKYT
jgi:hypothetical protein